MSNSVTPAADPAAVNPAATPAEPAAVPTAANPVEPTNPTPPASGTYTAEQMQEAVNKALKEAEELAKLNEAEREKKLREKADQELAELKAKIADKELGEYAAKQLDAAKLPQAFMPYVKGTDEKTTDERIAELGKIYKAAVDAGVEERFKALGSVRTTPAPSVQKTTAGEAPARKRGISFLGRR